MSRKCHWQFDCSSRRHTICFKATEWLHHSFPSRLSLLHSFATVARALLFLWHSYMIFPLPSMRAIRWLLWKRLLSAGHKYQQMRICSSSSFLCVLRFISTDPSLTWPLGGCTQHVRVGRLCQEADLCYWQGDYMFKRLLTSLVWHCDKANFSLPTNYSKSSKHLLFFHTFWFRLSLAEHHTSRINISSTYYNFHSALYCSMLLWMEPNFNAPWFRNLTFALSFWNSRRWFLKLPRKHMFVAMISKNQLHALVC
jgi:hypothetical protein